MNLREEILSTQALKDAMKNKDTVKLSVIRYLKSEIQRAEAGKFEMNETQISNLIKKTIQSVTENKDGDWEKEVETLSEFLPKQLSEDEVNTIVDEMIASGMNSIGPIMGRFSKEYGGRADGKLVSSLVKEKIG
jgi:hypothetical protein